MTHFSPSKPILVAGGLCCLAAVLVWLNASNGTSDFTPVASNATDSWENPTVIAQASMQDTFDRDLEMSPRHWHSPTPDSVIERPEDPYRIANTERQTQNTPTLAVPIDSNSYPRSKLPELLEATNVDSPQLEQADFPLPNLLENLESRRVDEPGGPGGQNNPVTRSKASPSKETLVDTSEQRAAQVESKDADSSTSGGMQKNPYFDEAVPAKESNNQTSEQPDEMGSVMDDNSFESEPSAPKTVDQEVESKVMPGPLPYAPNYQFHADGQQQNQTNQSLIPQNMGSVECFDEGVNCPNPAMAGSSPNRRRLLGRRNRSPKQSPVQGFATPPNFDGSFGHRAPYPTQRHPGEVSLENVPIDEDTQYPSFAEILANGRFYANAEALFIQPHFSTSSAVAIAAPGSSIGQPFDYDFEPAFQVEAGFLSEYGPGFGLNYFQFDHEAPTISFVSDGTQSGTTSVYQVGSNVWSSIVAGNAGERLDIGTSLEVHTFGFSVFKALEFKRASLTGQFGIRSARLNQRLNATLYNAGGAPVAALSHIQDFAGFGPTFGFIYNRRVGHTPLTMISSVTNTLLFGNRDQLVHNTYSNDFSLFSSDELIAIVDIFAGLELRKMTGEKRYLFGRFGFSNEAWIGGGTPTDPTANLGFQGLSMTIGMNH